MIYRSEHAMRTHELPQAAQPKEKSPWALSTLAIGSTIGLAFGISAGVGVFSYENSYAAADIVHAEGGFSTPMEERISAAMAKVTGMRIRVRCTPMPEEKREEAAYVHDIHGHMIPYVRIDPDICDNALKVEDHTNVFPEGQEFAAVAWSVRGITHESMHVWKNEHNESITDCYAVQRVGAMTLALGASQEVADQITSRVVILQPQLVTREYQVPGACHDGGTLDLDPAMQTAFPVPIPK